MDKIGSVKTEILSTLKIDHALPDARFLKVCRYDQLCCNSCYDKLGCNVTTNTVITIRPMAVTPKFVVIAVMTKLVVSAYF